VHSRQATMSLGARWSIRAAPKHCGKSPMRAAAEVIEELTERVTLRDF
jgi:hypothetical protein